MNKIKNVTVVSLSSGVIGESFVAHEVKLGVERLEKLGLTVRFAKHAKMGLDYIKAHPEKRAEDLLAALRDDECDMIFCAIGGDDTYRLLPYLFDNGELEAAVKASKSKLFLGFSDTTVNHFMLRKVGMNTFYGQSFLSDTCELDREMLPYTESFFRELIETGTVHAVRPSDTWYEDRTDYGEDQVGTPRIAHPNGPFELLSGAPVFSGEIFGGCLDTIYDMFDGGRYADMPILCQKYGLFPSLDEWRGKLLLLETSEEKMSPEKYRKGLEYLRQTGLFGVINGILAGKPIDEVYAEEYKKILVETVGDPNLPILFNVSIGHATPRCILPFGVKATVDANAQTVTFD